MRLRSLAVATTAALVVTLAPAAADAAQPAYKVSVSLSKTNADIGQTVTVSGKVIGPKAARKKLLVQRKVGAGGWKTVKKVATTRQSRYTTAVTVSSAGAQQYRVVAPKSNVRRAGTSSAKALTGWRWIDPTATALVEDLTRSTVTVDGRAYKNALVTTPDGSGDVLISTGNTCDALTLSVGMEGTIDSSGVAYVYQATSFMAGEPTSVGAKMVTGNQAPPSSRWSLKPTTGFLVIELNANSEGPTQRAALISPRVHCSTNTLPTTVVPAS